MEETYSLTKINKFLHQTLLFTEDVKTLLKLNCNEATFSLKSWCINTIPKQKDSKNNCTCSKSETEIEEIATRISRTLLQTQQLREKSCKNAVTEGRSKQISIHEIYKCQTADNKEKRGIKFSNVNNQKLCPVKKFNITKSDNQETRVDKLQTESLKRNVNKNSNKVKNTNSKQSTTCKAKLMDNKNFIDINKGNIKRVMEMSKYKNTNYKGENNSKSDCSIKKIGYVELGKDALVTSTSELRNLIQKVSFKCDNYLLFSNGDSLKCPLHDGTTSQSLYEQSLITMDIVDSLQSFNIPEEIIKSLKTYHTYLNTEILGGSLIYRKQQKAYKKFLVEFNKVDKIVQEHLISRTSTFNMLYDYTSLFERLLSKDINFSGMISIKEAFSELNVKWKMYDTKAFNIPNIWTLNMEKPILSNIHITGWMSYGIWNIASITDLKGISRLNYIHYINRHQLLLFFQMVQQLQQLQHLKNLITIILDNILPNVKIRFDHTKSEYVYVYKMFYILCQGLHSENPILVKTGV